MGGQWYRESPINWVTIAAKLIPLREEIGIIPHLLQDLLVCIRQMLESDAVNGTGREILHSYPI